MPDTENLASLKPADYNPRKISRHDFESLIKSIGGFGDLSGLVYNRRTKNIVGGHQRKEAYQQEGGEIEITESLESPNSVGTVARGYVVIADEKFTYRVVDWPEEKEKLANLAANRVSGEWDDDKLAELIYSIKDDPQINLSGFSDKEITEILATVSDVGEGVDDADLTPPDPENTITKVGDLWQLGEHRLLCGDSRSLDDFTELMGGRRASMVFTDPPYNIGYEGGMGGDGKKHKRRKIANDKMSGDDFFEFLNDVCRNLLTFADGAFYVCMSSSELHTLFRAFTENGGHWQTYIIWAKQNFTLGRSDYQHQYEPILYGVSDIEAAKFEDPELQVDALPILYGYNKHDWYGGRKQGDVWMVDRPTKSPDHPTEKPVTLPIRAIRNSSQRGEIVIDAFLGSGTTLIAAEYVQRVCYGMELDPAYCDVIVRRWEHLTGKKAELVKNIRESSDSDDER